MLIWYPVLVKWADGEYIYDEIKGLSSEDALKQAWENWSDASHIAVGEGEE